MMPVPIQPITGLKRSNASRSDGRGGSGRSGWRSRWVGWGGVVEGEHLESPISQPTAELWAVAGSMPEMNVEFNKFLKGNL